MQRSHFENTRHMATKMIIAGYMHDLQRGEMTNFELRCTKYSRLRCEVNIP